MVVGICCQDLEFMSREFFLEGGRGGGRVHELVKKSTICGFSYTLWVDTNFCLKHSEIYLTKIKDIQ